jgi:hypothetical protein
MGEGSAIMEGVREKTDKYCKYDAVSVALAFSSYGGWAEETFVYLEAVSRHMAQKDPALASRIFRKIRLDIAVALTIGQGRLIAVLNHRQALI